MTSHAAVDTVEMAAVEILISKITRDTSDEAAETLLNAASYLKVGKYRFNRTMKCSACALVFGGASGK